MHYLEWVSSPISWVAGIETGEKGKKAPVTTVGVFKLCPTGCNDSIVLPLGVIALQQYKLIFFLSKQCKQKIFVWTALLFDSVPWQRASPHTRHDNKALCIYIAAKLGFIVCHLSKCMFLIPHGPGQCASFLEEDVTFLLMLPFSHRLRRREDISLSLAPPLDEVVCLYISCYLL